MPRSRIAKDRSELSSGTTRVDRTDRSDWPEGEVLDGPEATTEGVAKSADRTNPAKQPGTTGYKSMPYPSVAELRESQRKGNEGKGTNPEDTKLNECQGHEVDVRE